MKAAILFSLLPLLAAANPPACLLQAVNTSDDPSDLGSICASKGAPSIQQAIFDNCASGKIESLAQSAFIATCSSAGSSVAKFIASSTESDSSSSTTKSSHSSSATSGSSSDSDSDSTSSSSDDESSSDESSSSSDESSSDESSSSHGTFVYTTAVYDSDCSCTSTVVTSATAASAASTGSLTTSTGGAANMLKDMGSLAVVMAAAVGVIAAL
ncbi:hypothetical protein DV735_g4047, partial [Chaetothyriales sp. CBS 134920]